MVFKSDKQRKRFFARLKSGISTIRTGIQERRDKHTAQQQVERQEEIKDLQARLIRENQELKTKQTLAQLKEQERRTKAQISQFSKRAKVTKFLSEGSRRFVKSSRKILKAASKVKL